MSAETVGGAAVMSESARNYRRQTERVASAGEQRLAAGGAAEAANEYGRRLIFLLFIIFFDRAASSVGPLSAFALFSLLSF